LKRQLLVVALLAGLATTVEAAQAAESGPSMFTTVPTTRIAGPAALGPAATTTVQITGRGGVPVAGVRAALVTITVTAPTAVTYLTVWPGGARPATSNLHAAAGQTVSTSMVVQLSGTGTTSIYNREGSLNVAVGVQGYFAGSGAAAGPAGG
jgi:hypothetical protein